MTKTAVHTIVCNASAEAVYAVIADSARWPGIFEPCLAVKPLSQSDNAEHIEVTALVNGVAMTWESYRVFQPEIFAIDTRVQKPMKLVKTMDAAWRVIAISPSQAVLVL